MNNGLIQKVYDESTWPEFDEILNEEISAKINQQISDEQRSAMVDAKNQYQIAANNYHNGFNWFKYRFYIFLMIMSFLLLFIPLFWLYPAYKRMKNEKEDLKEVLDKITNQKVNLYIQVASPINFLKILHEAWLVIKYDHQGPIPAGFVNVLNNNVVFQSEFIQDTPNQNNFSTSWGIFSEDKIIINIAKKKHWMESKRYQNSESFSYIEFVGNERVMRTEILTAYFSHPAPKYSKEYYSASFSPSCEGLSFHLESYKYKRIFKKKEEIGQAEFDNKIFNSSFDYQRNDEAKIRMIFTADVQEYMVEKREEIQNSKLPNYLSYWKKFCLYGTKQLMNLEVFGKKDFGVELLKNPEVSFDEFTNLANQKIRQIVNEKFLQLNLVTNVPLLVTEDHQNIIRDLMKLYQSTNISQEDQIYAQNILSTIIQFPILEATTTDEMDVIEIISKERFENFIITNTLINGYSFCGVDKIAQVWVTGYNVGARLISVPYIDYLERNGHMYMSYAKLKIDYFLYESVTNLPQDILEKINSISKKVFIRDGHIVCLSDSNSSHEMIKSILKFFNQDNNGWPN